MKTRDWLGRQGQLSAGHDTNTAPMFEQLEPRLLLSGVIDLSMFMSIDYDEPDQTGKDYQVSLEVTCEDLIRMEVSPPWDANESFDSDDHLPSGWDGNDFEIGDGDFWFEGGTEGGRRWFGLGREQLTADEWDSIKNGGDFQITVYYTGGSWNGTVDFNSVTVQTQEPVLTNPVHGQTDVSLAAEVQWEAFQYSSLNDGVVHINFVNETDDLDLEEVTLSPDATSWTPSQPLQPGKEYQIELAFADTSIVPVNGIDVFVVAFTESDHYFTTATAGVKEVEVDRGDDRNGPGVGDEELSYFVEVGGNLLTGLEVTTPWGAVENSDDWLPAGWSGGDFFDEDNGVEFDVYTEDGLLWFSFEWEELNATQWDTLNAADGYITARHAGGTWTGQVDFDGVPMPSQVPVTVAPGPVDGQADVPLNPTFHWTQWAAPDTPQGGLWWELEEELTENLIHEEDHAPADTTNWATSQVLKTDTQYAFAVDFHNVGNKVINGADVTVVSWNESHILFTTTDTPAFKQILTPGSKTGKWTFEDANGDQVTVKFAGKQGSVEIVRAVPEGARGDILEIILAGTNATSSLTITTKGKGAETTVGEILVNGSLKALTAKTTDIVGAGITATGGGYIGSIQVRDIRNGADIIMPGAGAPRGITIKAGQLYADTDIVLGSYLKSLTAVQWTGSSLTAPWASNISIKGNKKLGIAGDFGADITLTEADPKRGLSLNKLQVAGRIVGSEIILAGGVGTIMAAQWDSGSLDALWAKNIMTKGNRRDPSITGDFSAMVNLHGEDPPRDISLNKLQVAGRIVGSKMTLAGGVGTIMAAQWDSGSLDALWAKNIKTKGNRRDASITGNFGATLNLTGQDPKKGISLNKLQVAGTAVDATVRTFGSMGSLMFGAVQGSDFLAGIAGAADRHASAEVDFVNPPAFIKSVKIKGWKVPKGEDAPRFYTDSNFSAATLGTIKLLNIDYDNGDEPFGLFALDQGTETHIKSISLKDTITGEKWKWPLVPVGDGIDFEVLVI